MNERATHSAELCRQLFEHIHVNDIVPILIDPVDDQVTRVDLPVVSSILKNDEWTYKV